ncbi:MAG: Aminopeptidase YpdF [Alphaproteobacteria bacterium]|nr:MAG: Aminopeptidase YpdF [Alphaproteobacteria bacterium]
MFQNFDDDHSTNDVAPRVKALRARLAKRKLDGLIVPREDEYQGEYVPAANERLKYISGFGGSAGTAIILARKAALFVDGRYILQAPKQTDTKLFSIVDIMQTAPSQWLAATVKKGMEIGLDPRLHSETAVKAYRDRLSAKGARLVLLDENPLDADWHNRPELPDSPVVIQPTRFAGRSSEQKRKALAAEMKTAGHDMLLVAQPENIAWLLNIRATDVPHTPFALSFGLLNKNGSFDWFIRQSRVDATVRAHIGRGLRLHRQGDMLAKLKALKGKTVAFDPSNTPAWFAEQMQDVNLVRITDPCALPKAAKHKAEIKASITAHEMDGAALCNFLAWFDKNAGKGELTEICAAKQAEACRAASGKLLDLSFDTISGTGPNGAIVHYRVTEKTNRAIKPGDLYLIDSGGQYQQGTTDVTRTVLVEGGKAPAGAIDAFTRVLRGHIALAMAHFPPGTNGMQLDTLARAPLWEVGLDFDHGTGHGVGSYLSVHEGPQRISKGGTVALEEGMIVSNEPGYYKTNAFGIRIENLQYVTPLKKTRGACPMMGFEPLTLAPIDRRLIDKSQMSAAEIAWLDAYHKRVQKTLLPMVDKSTKSWLKANCKSL